MVLNQKTDRYFYMTYIAPEQELGVQDDKRYRRILFDPFNGQRSEYYQSKLQEPTVGARAHNIINNMILDFTYSSMKNLKHARSAVGSNEGPS